MIVLETERLLLRRPMLNDLDALIALGADAQVMKYVTGGPSPSPAALRQWLKDHARTFEQGGFGMLSVIDHRQGEFIGQCGFQTVAVDEAETPILSCLLQRASWGLGLGAEALLAVRDHAFTKLDMDTVHALIHPDHKAGLRLADKLDMAKRREVDVQGRSQRLYAAQRDSK